MNPPTAILLVNVGTPDEPTPRAVSRYLKEFLGDPDVLRMPGPLRFLLVRGFIAPLRGRRSAAKYARIWAQGGSPLRTHTETFSRALQKKFADKGRPWQVHHAMRYGNPSLSDVISRLKDSGVRRLVTFPLFPQHAEATTGSVLKRVGHLSANSFDPHPIAPFYQETCFIQAFARPIQKALGENRRATLLFSYHGLPLSHLQGPHCNPKNGACCDHLPHGCYRAQCLATTRALAKALTIDPQQILTTFQSRLGPGRWMGPSTEETLRSLPARGVHHLVVATPSFVADCLETLEEISIEARSVFLQSGGKTFTVVPCPNDDPLWVQGAATLVEQSLPREWGSSPVTKK